MPLFKKEKTQPIAQPNLPNKQPLEEIEEEVIDYEDDEDSNEESDNEMEVYDEPEEDENEEESEDEEAAEENYSQEPSAPVSSQQFPSVVTENQLINLKLDKILQNQEVIFSKLQEFE